jgi:hypothetical protein
MKKCKACNIEKDTTEFSYHYTNKDRLFGRCKPCESKIRAESHRKDRLKNPEKYRAYDLRKNFDMSPEEYKAKFDEQNGVCAICGRPEFRIRRGRVESLGVDHNHTTGKNRGLLCHTCNSAIGLLKDSPELLELAAQYLRKYL